MMQVMKDIGGVELPETLARFTQDMATTNGGAPAAGAAPRAAEPVAEGARQAAAGR